MHSQRAIPTPATIAPFFRTRREAGIVRVRPGAQPARRAALARTRSFLRARSACRGAREPARVRGLRARLAIIAPVPASLAIPMLDVRARFPLWLRLIRFDRPI